jgi:hypothetical protein
VSRRGRSLGVTNRRSSDPPHRCDTLRSLPLFYSGSPCLQGSSLPVVARFAPKSSTSLDLKAFSAEESVAPEADESTTGARCSLGLFSSSSFHCAPRIAPVCFPPPKWRVPTALQAVQRRHVSLPVGPPCGGHRD